jgi:hypothetical protein
VSFTLTTQGLKALGVDYEGGLCPGAGSGNVVDVVLSAITATDCTQWTLSAALQEQVNLDAKPLANPSLLGTISCDPQGRCAEVYAVGPPTSASPAAYCLRHVGGPAFTTSGITSTPVAGFTPQYAASPAWYGGRKYQTSTWKQPSNCPTISGTQVGAIYPVLEGTGQPFLYWGVDIAAVAPGSGTGLALPPPLHEDPLRTLRCVVNLTTGSPLTANTGTFTLGGG